MVGKLFTKICNALFLKILSTYRPICSSGVSRFPVSLAMSVSLTHLLFKQMGEIVK